MRINQLIIALSLAATASFVSCVPARQVEELQAKHDKCEAERNQFASEVQKLETETKELNATLSELQRQTDGLLKDTAILGTSYRRVTAMHDRLNDKYNELLELSEKRFKGNEAENRKLMAELQRRELDLQNSEDGLRRLADDLKKQEDDLKAMEGNLKSMESELQAREAKVQELQKIISDKEKAVQALKDRIAQALLGFADKGLTVEQKDGKIYVSMSAKLLFPKGSTTIDPEGKKAIVELGKVLADQKDIDILVEGHTDTDKLSGTGALKDNWDLSVMRATAVVRILTQTSGMDPNRLTAAGRGEFIPVDQGTTEEAKAKNRRIEVILTPDLDKLFEILEN